MSDTTPMTGDAVHRPEQHPVPSEGPVLVARGVRRTFDAETAPVRALRGADLAVEPGEFVAMMDFCCLEALQNVGKHAADSQARVRLWRDGLSLAFEVSDDGPGFDATATARGDGLHNITDRVGAVGVEVCACRAPSRSRYLASQRPLGF